MYSVRCKTNAVPPVSPYPAEKRKCPWSVCTVRQQMCSNNKLLASHKSVFVSIESGWWGGGGSGGVSLLRAKF